MKKQLRNIIISLCVVVLLVIGVVIWRVAVPQSSSTTSSDDSSSTPSITVYKTDSAGITQLRVENAKGGFTINQANKKLSLVGMPTGILSQDSLTDPITSAADITASQLIEKNSANLAQYGLSSPKQIVYITSGGKTETIDIGNATPTNDGNYLCVAGSKDVYKVDSSVSSTFADGKLDFVNLSIVGVDASNLAKLTELDFGGSSRNAPIVLKIDPASVTAAATSSGGDPTYNMVSPRTYPVDSDKTSTIVEALESLSASNVISLDMSNQNLAKYGLADPKYTFSATYNGKKMTLDVGTPYSDSGTTYLPVVLEGTPVIYAVDASTFSFYNYQLTDICSTLLYTENINNIKSVTVTTGGKSYTVDLTGTDDGLKGTYNGKSLATQNIRNWYEQIIGVTFEGAASMPANPTSYAKVVFTYRNGKTPPETLDFLSLDSLKCYWSVNGNVDFYVLKQNVDAFVTATQNLVAGKTVAGD